MRFLPWTVHEVSKYTMDRLPAAPRTREVLEGLRARCGDERADMLTVYFAAMAAAGLIRINDRIDEVNRDMILYAVFALGTKLGVTAEEGHALLAAHKADLADMEAAHGK